MPIDPLPSENLKETIEVVVVEDNPGDAMLIEDMLAADEVHDFRIAHFESLSEAGEFLLRTTNTNIILLDLHLPDGQGSENIDYIRRYSSDVPLVILTGLNDNKLAAQMVKEGVQDYLVKGQFDTNILVRSIRYAIERQHNIRQLESVRELEKYLAYYDALTGLPNRELFYDRLSQSIAKAERTGTKTGLIFLDLDRFKEVNDTYGHQAGDGLLQSVAQRLQQCVRNSDTVARLGGDEFTIILECISTIRDLTEIAQKILRDLVLPHQINEYELSTAASLGISIYPDDAKEVETLIKRADTAMYRAKEHGRNTYEVFDLGTDIQSFDQLETINALKRALEENEFSLRYQPLFDPSSDSITAVEALVRWEHPKFGIVNPDKFIPLAEKTGLIIPLGEWVIQQACRDNKELQRHGYTPIRMNVNLSTRQFRSRNLQETIFSSLERTQLDAEFLGLEITETSVMQDFTHASRTLNSLRDAGIQIAIDDFGAGYSSLSYLKNLPADILKIDRSFVEGIPRDEATMSITETIIDLAHRLDLSCVAEGVETAEQHQFLKDQDCDSLQGFYMSEPLAFDDLEQRMACPV